MRGLLDDSQPLRWSARKTAFAAFGGLAIVALLGALSSGVFSTPKGPKGPDGPDSLCPVVAKIDPSEYVYDKERLQEIFHDGGFRNASIDRLMESLRYPTESYDQMVNPNAAATKDELYKLEPAWRQFELFHGFLERAFPLVHKHLKVEKINKFALVYTWEGLDSTKKPILVTAHQDVVPVQKETVNQWRFPPYEGGYDPETDVVYGRGVADCKNLLIGILETLEMLIKDGKFQPQRTIVAAFGYDEESQGTGAYEVNKHLVSRYGENSFYAIVDEGNEAYTEYAGLNFILPGTAEKGHLDSSIEIFTPGGHALMPPDHTGIGILARLIALIEDVQFGSALTPANPLLNQLQCVAQHSPEIGQTLKKDILRAHFDQNANKAVLEYLEKDPLFKYYVKTSQAVDVIQGGAKVNALPEHASILINHRIAVEDLVASTGKKVLKQIEEVAKKYDLGVFFEGKEIRKPTENGYFNYTFVQPLEPSPVTPVNDDEWSVFGGILRYLYEDLVFPGEKKEFLVSPFLMPANTDTRRYWDLSTHIYRYLPGIPWPEMHAHSVDEQLPFGSHIQIVAWMYAYLQVVDVQP